MVIYPDSFNIKPDSEVTVAFSNLLSTASENAKPKSLLLEKGNYVFLSKYAQERELYITNTIADKEYNETDKKHVHKITLRSRRRSRRMRKPHWTRRYRCA